MTSVAAPPSVAAATPPAKFGDIPTDWLAWSTVVATVSAFLACIAPTVRTQLLRDDLAWYVPTIWQGLHRYPLPDVFWFLSNPTQREYGVASLNFYVAGMLTMFGLQPSAIVAAGVALHLIGAVLVYRLGRGIGLGRHASLGAGLLWVVYMPSFGAYLWPMAAQHQMVVLAALLVVERYLATERAARM
ncbi:MAG: hypothetical protein JOZ65_15730, partial [Chloroflexi bacterium]|nr:hypothetical protein [Chloroflexota bacterium]